MEAPKLFISYSWSSQEHETLVVNLATELRESGVDVVLDKWDLKEGHDAYAFMEKMVSDETISKVLIVSDKKYADKANGREGGVGTETQIISSEIYAKIEQDKFVLAITEKDDNGQPYLPTYYKSRIFIDLAESESYAKNFEQLLRWIYDKPLYIKPEIGKAPSFLEEKENMSLQTSTLSRRAIDAIKNSKSYADGALLEYFNTYSTNLEKFRMEPSLGHQEFDEKVLENIELFIPYRNEMIEMFLVLAQYDLVNVKNRLHSFFESLIPYTNRPADHHGSYHKWDYDNFKFIIQELLLYCIASFLKYERYEVVEYLLQNRYYCEDIMDRREETLHNFGIFRNHLTILEHRNTRLELRRLSLMADIFKDRCKGIGITFEQLMQADFVLFLVDSLQALNEERYQGWWPETLVYKTSFPRPFEIFARSESVKYFDRIKSIFGVQNKSEFEPLMEAYSSEKLHVPKYQFDRVIPTRLMDFEKLCSRK